MDFVRNWDLGGPSMFFPNHSSNDHQWLTSNSPSRLDDDYCKVHQTEEGRLQEGPGVVQGPLATYP